MGAACAKPGVGAAHREMHAQPTSQGGEAVARAAHANAPPTVIDASVIESVITPRAPAQIVPSSVPEDGPGPATLVPASAEEKSLPVPPGPIDIRDDADDFPILGLSLVKHTSLAILESDEPSASDAPSLDLAAIRLCETGPGPLSSFATEARLLAVKPRLILLDHFLTPGECEALCSLAAPLLEKSRVANGSESDKRHSRSAFLLGCEGDTTVTEIERRIAGVCASPGISRLVARGGELVANEPLQVVHYTPGQYYESHYDNKDSSCLTRAATVMIYLNDVEGGGATLFPHAISAGQHRSPGGMRVFPRRGRAVIFFSQGQDGREDSASIHSAEVITAGEKWIVTSWRKNAACQ